MLLQFLYRQYFDFSRINSVIYILKFLEKFTFQTQVTTLETTIILSYFSDLFSKCRLWFSWNAQQCVGLKGLQSHRSRGVWVYWMYTLFERERCRWMDTIHLKAQNSSFSLIFLKLFQRESKNKLLSISICSQKRIIVAYFF